MPSIVYVDSYPESMIWYHNLLINGQPWYYPQTFEEGSGEPLDEGIIIRKAEAAGIHLHDKLMKAGFEPGHYPGYN